MEDFLRQALLMSGIQVDDNDLSLLVGQMATMMQTIVDIMPYRLSEVHPVQVFQAEVNRNV